MTPERHRFIRLPAVIFYPLRATVRNRRAAADLPVPRWQGMLFCLFRLPGRMVSILPERFFDFFHNPAHSDEQPVSLFIHLTGGLTGIIVKSLPGFNTGVAVF